MNQDVESFRKMLDELEALRKAKDAKLRPENAIACTYAYACVFATQEGETDETKAKAQRLVDALKDMFPHVVDWANADNRTGWEPRLDVECDHDYQEYGYGKSVGKCVHCGHVIVGG